MRQNETERSRCHLKNRILSFSSFSWNQKSITASAIVPSQYWLNFYFPDIGSSFLPLSLSSKVERGLFMSLPPNVQIVSFPAAAAPILSKLDNIRGKWQRIVHFHSSIKVSIRSCSKSSESKILPSNLDLIWFCNESSDLILRLEILKQKNRKIFGLRWS